MVHGEKYRTSFWGLNREQVNRKLNNIKTENENKLAQLKSEIETIKIENENLTHIVEMLRRDILNEEETKGFMAFSLSKVEQYIPLIYEEAEKEITEIRTIGEKTEMVFDKKIEEFKQIIMETQNALDTLLKNILDLNEDLGYKLKQFIEDKQIYKIPIIGYKNSAAKETSNKIESKEIEIEKNDTQYLIDSNIAEERVEINKHNNLSEKQISKQSSGFWGEEIEETVINISDNKLIEPPVEKNNDIDDIENKVQNKEGVESKVIASEISRIRNKYLIGKIVGENLLGKTGEVIIHKNTIINNEIIDTAEKEGKLAELIVNMTLPEIE